MIIVGAGGGGGCFPGDVEVMTPTGVVRMRDVQVGQKVLSFDEKGATHEGTVTKVFEHSEMDVLAVRYWGGSLRITPNHWVLNQFNTFAEVGTLTPLDALVDSLGHLRPIIAFANVCKEHVYNLHVEPHHTFIADNIRVHNGGLGLSRPYISGAGGGGDGKGGGGGRAAVEDPDSLQSHQYAKVMDLLSEGPIGGLVDGLKSIYLDDTPLQAADGTMNFSGVTVDWRYGTPDQLPFDGFPSVQNEYEIGVEIKKTTPVVRAISGNIDAINVTVGVPSLLSRDMSTGDIHGTSVEIKIEIDHNGGGYKQVAMRLDPFTEGITLVGNTATLPGSYGFEFTYSYTLGQSGATWNGWRSSPIYAAMDVVIEYKAPGSGVWAVLATESVQPTVTVTRSPSNWSADETGGIWYVGGYEETVTTYTGTRTHKMDSEISGTWEVRARVTSTYGSVTASKAIGKHFVGTDIIKGKASARYRRSYYIKLPKSGGANTWSIRVSRLTDDHEGNHQYQDQTWFDSITEIVESKFVHPHSAIVASLIDAEQFNHIPKRGFDIYGIICEVPSNYDPIHRTYTGLWNGTFIERWTNNPAWIFRDIVTKTRYGLGQFIDAALLDKWNLYEIAQYCDELVPSGFGYMEPRFTCNVYLQTAREAYSVLADLASVFRGMSYWAASGVAVSSDMPSDPVMTFSQANVKDGVFSYSGSSRKVRHTVALVSYNDPTDMYRQQIEYVEDLEGIARYGVNATEVAAFGCASRGQARRAGSWILYTEKLETEVVAFSTGMDGVFLYPGAVIKIADKLRSGTRMGGRVVSAAAAVVTIDSPVTLLANTAYKFLLITTTDVTINPDATEDHRPRAVVVEHDVVQVGVETTTSEITLTAPVTVQPNAMWLLSYGEVQPQTFRVIGIEEDGPYLNVTALAHNPSKYAAIEEDKPLEHPPITSRVMAPPLSPVGLAAEDTLYWQGPSVLGTKLHFSWNVVYNNLGVKDNSGVATGVTYEVKYRQGDDNWIHTQTLTPYIDIAPVREGAISLAVRAVDALGRKSQYTQLEYTVLGKTVPPAAPAFLAAALVTGGIKLSWPTISDLDLAGFEIVCNGGSPISVGLATEYVWPSTPVGDNSFVVRAIDTTGNLSTDTTTTLTISTPQTPTLAMSVSGQNVIATVTPAAPAGNRLPIIAYRVSVGPTFVGSTVIADGMALVVSHKAGTAGAYTYWVVALDSAGNTSSAASSALTITAPAAPGAPVVPQVPSVFEGGTLRLSWSAPAAQLPIAEYVVRYGSASGTLLARVTGTSFPINATWVGVRNFFVAAVDTSGNEGASYQIATTITAPAAVVFDAVAYAGPNVVLKWPAPAATLPIVEYEIRDGATFSSAPVIGKAKTTTHTLAVSWSGSRTFWVVPIDSAGNYGTEQSITITPTALGAPATFNGAVDNSDFALAWSAPTTGSLPVDRYEIRYGTSWASGTYVTSVYGLAAKVPASWLGARTFWIAAIDTAGVVGTSRSYVGTLTGPTITPATPVLNHTFSGNLIYLSWPAATGSFPVVSYEVRQGPTWATAASMVIADKLDATIPAFAPGAVNIHVRAKDSRGNESAEITKSVTVTAPSAPSVASSVVGVKAQLSWGAPASSFPVSSYEIRYGASWAAGTFVAVTSALNHRVNIDWTGARTFWVAAVDAAGNVGTAGSATAITVVAPPAPSLTATFSNEFVNLDWTAVAGTLPLDSFEVRYGASWAAGTSLGSIKGTTLRIKATWSGSRTFWVRAKDVNGTQSADGTATANVTPPSAPTLTAQVVDNNVLLYWTGSTGTLPIDTYEVRRGSSWAGATVIGQKSGGFTTVFETVAGLYTYWVAAVDTAGNYGTPAQRAAAVSQPPDYVLRADNNIVFADKKWTFDSTVQGWTATNATVAQANGALALTATASSPNIWSPVDNMYGGKYTTIRAAIKRTGGSASSWAGTLYYSTAGHGVSGSYYNTAKNPNIAVGQSAIVEWDMADLIVGGTDWITNWIIQMRMDLGAVSGDNFEVDWVEAGRPYHWNTVVDETACLLLPVPSYDTYAAHFADRGWASPNDQVNAGYPVYIEPRTLGSNYLKYSEVMTRSPWVTGGSGTTVENAGAYVDGLLTLETLTDNNASGWGSFVQQSTLPNQSGVSWVVSLHVLKDAVAKSTRYSILRLRGLGVVANTYADVAFATDTGEAAIGNTTAGVTNVAVGVADLGTVWRFYVTCKITDPLLTGWSAEIYAAGGATAGALSSPLTYSAATTGSLTCGGAQLEPGTVPSHYLKTFANWIGPTGLYEETFDYGQVLSATKINLSYSGETISGTPVITPKISVKTNIGDAWTDYDNTTSVFASNFRFAKVALSITGGLYRITSMNARLDAKQIGDSGSVSAVSTDTNGTLVNFNTSFIDVSSINVTAQGTTSITPVYDFSDSVKYGTYSIAAGLCTLSVTGHALTQGMKALVTFTSGGAPNGAYTVTYVDANTVTFALAGNDGKSGQVSIYPNGMKVYAFNSTTGARVTAPVSWNIKGY